MVTKETHRGVISRPFTVLYFIPCGSDFLSKTFHTIFLVIYFKLKIVVLQIHWYIWNPSSEYIIYKQDNGGIKLMQHNTHLPSKPDA
jgi:hypothetical protein